MRRTLALTALLPILTGIVLSVVAPTPAVADAADRCGPGQTPRYVFGFADLQSRIFGDMGDPLTCEYPDPTGNGDVHQQTTKGLAFWRKSTNTSTFTDGFNHWGLVEGRLVAWTGSSIDPPGVAVAPQPALFRGDPRAISLTVDDFGLGWLVASSDAYLADGLYVASFAQQGTRIRYEVYVKVSPDMASAETYWSSAMAGLIPGYIQRTDIQLGDKTLGQWASEGAVLRVRVKNVNLQLSTNAGPSIDALLPGMQRMIQRVNTQVS